MTRKSERELERALEELNPTDTDPVEFIITDRVVETEWSAEDGDDVDVGEIREVRKRRTWRDEAGEWHSERVAPESDGGGES